MMRVWPGQPYPLGATWDGNGVNFAVFSQHSSKAELCLFDSTEETKESQCIVMPERTDHVWHCYLPDAKPGQLYGFRFYGPYEPYHGHRFNPHKVVLDPYAFAIGRGPTWNDAMFGYKVGSREADLSFDDRDNAAWAPLGCVIDRSFRWGSDRHPRTPWHKTIIYEMHVKGFTKRHPAIPKALRGTYGGLAHKASIQYLLDLGVTAVELMPVHSKVNDRFLTEKGLTNYWGYNNLNFFAPEPEYATSSNPQEQVLEFKRMVKRLHQAGIEVILDVVYNHTAEGNHTGPMLSFRGIDNACYYRLVAGDARHYMDYTGCGNTLNMQCPRVLQLIMDSLRYWVLEMHVDGFRFDLASALARELHDVDQLGAFLDIIHQDPVLSQVKLIAEPWDLGEGGYQVGNFPVGWAEWNGKYRDCVRSFWRGDHGAMSEFATRLTGSSDLYQHNGRRPYASINFVTSHDGFCLRDLVSYNEKHNHANGEGNRDGDNHNISWNCGVEGETDDKEIKALRVRQRKNFLTTLLLSQGVAMIRAGDELGHTQNGNNNAYCQDNELSWLDWEMTEEKQEFLQFVKRVIRLWRMNPVFQRRKFFQGKEIRGAGVNDVTWLTPDGEPMPDHAWFAHNARCLGMRLEGNMEDEFDERGQPIVGKTFLMYFNASHKPILFKLPGCTESEYWRPALDSSGSSAETGRYRAGQKYIVQPRTVVAFRLKKLPLSMSSKFLSWFEPSDAKQIAELEAEQLRESAIIKIREAKKEKKEQAPTSEPPVSAPTKAEANAKQSAAEHGSTSEVKAGESATVNDEGNGKTSPAKEKAGTESK